MALRTLGESFTWKQLEDLSTQLSRVYLGIGLKSGDRFASYMPVSAKLFIHYLACFKIGVISVPLNSRGGVHEINQALDVSEASHLLTWAKCTAPIKNDIRKKLGSSKLLFIEKIFPGKGSIHLDEDLNSNAEAIDTEKPVGIYFTSGSTGNPKGVVHTYRSLKFIFKSLVDGFAIRNTDILFPAKTGFSAYIFSFAALSQGATVILSGSLKNDEVLYILKKFKPTIFGMSVAKLNQLFDDNTLTKSVFKSIRLFLLGGDKISLKMLTHFHRSTGKKMLEGYGMTEIGVSHNNIPSSVKKGSVGRPMPYFSYSVRNTRGLEVQGEVGELWIKGPTVMKGYWMNTEATDEVLKDGWLSTGDLVKIDSEGFLWFCGRKKQVIIHGGTNVSPQEVEEVLVQHPAIENAVVVGKRDETFGELIHAFIIVKKGVRKPSQQKIISFCQALIAHHKIPGSFTFLDRLPSTSAGKVDRLSLLKLATKITDQSQ